VLPLLRYIPFAVLALGIAELAVMISVGARIGTFAVILLLIAGIVAGSSLIRASGTNLAELMRGRGLSTRQVSENAAKGLTLALAGVLLILPGFLSDFAAGVILLPPVRTRVADFLEKHVNIVKRDASPGPVIEGEAVEIEATDRIDRR
jgi:UPF0716 protein FxsA